MHRNKGTFCSSFLFARMEFLISSSCCREWTSYTCIQTACMFNFFFFNGTARCTTVHPYHMMTYGTTHWSFSIWFVTDSVVPQQAASQSHTYEHTQEDKSIHTSKVRTSEEFREKRRKPLACSSALRFFIALHPWYDPVQSKMWVY